MHAAGLGRPLREIVKIAVPCGIETKVPLLTKGIMKKGRTARRRDISSFLAYAWNAKEVNYTGNVTSSPDKMPIFLIHRDGSL